jgi:hypothetical protein
MAFTVSRWTGRFLLLVAGVCVGLVAAEIGLRLARPDDAVDLLYNAPDNAPDGLYTTDRTVFAIPTPGFNGTQKSLGYSVNVRINSLGLRGPEVGQKDRRRFLAAGDSFTMAAQVSEDETFVERLSNDLNMDFFNAGVDGYGTYQVLERYKQLDSRLDLDGLLLTFFVGNDVHDNVRWPQIQAEARRMVAGKPLSRRPVGAVHGFLYKRSAVYAAIQMALRRRALSSPNHPERHRWKSELMLFTQEGAGVLGAQLPATSNALSDLKRAVEERGDQLMVAVAPPAFQIEQERMNATFQLVGLNPQNARLDAVSTAVVDLLKRKRIPHCDLVEPLRRAQHAGGELYLQYDGHWSPKGHAVVADAIERCFKQGRH